MDQSTTSMVERRLPLESPRNVDCKDIRFMWHHIEEHLKCLGLGCASQRTPPSRSQLPYKSPEIGGQIGQIGHTFCILSLPQKNASPRHCQPCGCHEANGCSERTRAGRPETAAWVRSPTVFLRSTKRDGRAFSSPGSIHSGEDILNETGRAGTHYSN